MAALSLLDFTSFSEIRAILGVEADELTDDTLSLDLYAFALRSEFNEVDAAILPRYATLAAATDPRSDDEQALYEGCRLFAAYAVSCRLASSLPLFSPKDVTDGKAATARFADGPYRVVIAEAKSQYDRLRLQLPALLNKVDATSTAVPQRNYFAVTSPDTDPVVAS
jgi:hypothetical protein